MQGIGTIDEVVEHILRQDNAGIFTDEQSLDRDYMYAVLNKARAVAIPLLMEKNKRVNVLWFQKEVLPFDTTIQVTDACYVLFKHEPVLALNGVSDGFIYVGSKTGNYNYTKCNGRADLSVYQNHRVTRGRGIQYIWSNGYLEIYNNLDLQNVMTETIRANPLLCRTYRQDVDRYPISDDLLQTMQDIIFKTDGQYIVNRPKDAKSDSADTLVTPGIK